VRPLAPSPVWTLVTPYCKRTRPRRGTNTKAAGFPPLSRPSPATSLPPFALGLAPTHLGWGTRRHFTRRLRNPPVTKRRHCSTQKCHHTHRKSYCFEAAVRSPRVRSVSRLLKFYIEKLLLHQAASPSARKLAIKHLSLRHTLERNWFQRPQGHTLEEYHVIRSYTVLRAYP
jgi:hypothetical protein